MSPYGMTYKQVKELSKELSDLLDIEADKIELAMDQITRDNALRIAKNVSKED